MGAVEVAIISLGDRLFCDKSQMLLLWLLDHGEVTRVPSPRTLGGSRMVVRWAGAEANYYPTQKYITILTTSPGYQHIYMYSALDHFQSPPSHLIDGTTLEISAGQFIILILQLRNLGLDQ